MKTTHAISIFAAGLLVGIGAMLAIGPVNVSDPSPSPGDRAAGLAPRTKEGQGEKLRARNGDRKRSKLADRPKVVEEEKKSSQGSPLVSALGASGVQLPEGFIEKMKEQQKHREQTQLAARLATLRERLGLSPEQEAKIKALFEEKSGRRLALMETALNAGKKGNKNGDQGALVELIQNSSPSKPTDEAVRDLLDQDQIAAYDEYQEEQRRNRVEITANRRLTELQGMFTLTEDQKNAAYEVFSHQAEEQVASMPSIDPVIGSPSHALILPGGRDNEPLREILTEEQFEAYNARSSNTFFSTEGGEGAAVGTTTTIILDSLNIGEGGAVLPAGAEVDVEVIEVESEP